MDGVSQLVTAASLLFGFLFTGFWWCLNRELTFQQEERDFRLGHGLLLGTMVVVAVFGICWPLWRLANGNPVVADALPMVLCAFVGAFGYMLTELAHYGVFEKQRYTGRFEAPIFWTTVVLMAGLLIWGLLRTKM